MEQRVLFKRDYNVDDNNDYLLVKEFLICGDEEHKELVLKLINTTNENCKDLKFIVHQLDKDGKEIALSTFESRYMKANAGKEFVPNKAMTLNKECEDVVIELQFAAFQTAYYTKGELVPFEEKSNSHFIASEDNRFVKNRLTSKPILIAILVVLSIVSLVSFINNSVDNYRVNTKQFVYDGLHYEILNSNQELKVVGYDSDKNISNLVIPEYVGEFKVKSIEANAFSYNPQIVSLTISGDLSIENSAFENCNNLTTLNINQVSSIGDRAFMGCDSLQNVTLYNLGYLGESAFADCINLQSAVVENENLIIEIRPNVFNRCKALNTIVIDQPTSLLSDLTNILGSCYNVRNLTLNELDKSTVSNLFGGTTTLDDLSLETIKINELNTVSAKMFANFQELKKVTIGRVLNGKIEKEAFAYTPKLEEVVFENPITVIGEKAFTESGIKSFNFNGVQVIGPYAFAYSQITKVNLTNSSVSTIDKFAFNMCSELTEVILNNSLKEIKLYAFSNCTKLSRFEMSSGINAIGEHAFDRCESLSAINLPKTLKTIDSYAFANCLSLAVIDIPGSVYTISGSTFAYCQSLEKVVINEGTTIIGTSAFNQCTNIKTLEIPNSVNRIFSGCFNGCSAIEYLTIPFIGIQQSNPGNFNTIFSSNLPNLKEITISNSGVLQNALLAYKQNLEKVTIKGQINTIPKDLCSNCPNLKEVNIPNTIETIEMSAFRDCFNLRKITLPETLKIIGSAAFINCYCLWEVENYSSISVVPGVPNDARGEIGEYTIAVYNTENDERMLFETVDDSFLFGYYEGKTYLLDFVGDELDVVLPTNVKIAGLTDPVSTYEIYSLAFYGSEINSVNIPEGISKIGPKAFGNCAKLELVYLPNSITDVYNDAFESSNRIFEVFNLTNYNLTIGSDDLGYVAANALVIHTSLDDLPLVKYTSEYLVDYRLNPNNNKGWILGFTDTEELPESITIGNTLFIDNKGYSSFEILPNAFERTNITDLTIGSSIKTIPNGAFLYCNNLLSVNIQGNRLESIGENAFYNCNSLTDFNLSTNSRLSTIGAGAFAYTNLYKFLLPSYMSSIGNDAFYNCENLTFVINQSNLTISKGFSSYGRIAYYAFDVVKSENEIITVEYNNFTFAKKSNVWYIIGFDEELFNESLIKFPGKFTSGGYTINEYYVWKNLSYSLYQYYDLLIPTNLTHFDGEINIYLDTIYYEGTSNQWYNSYLRNNSTLRSADVKFYSTCVHYNSTWTYVNNEISTSFTALNDNIIQAATCTTNGINRKYCSKCNYTEEHTIYATGHSYGSNNQCTKCSARKVPVTDTVLNSALFSNDQNNPFVWSNGYIVTPTLDRYETSTLTLNANRKMRVEMTFNGYLSSYDNVEIVVNGVTQNVIYSSNLYSWNTYTFELSAGQSLEIMYNKQSSDTSTYVNISMTIYYE